MMPSMMMMFSTIFTISEGVDGLIPCITDHHVGCEIEGNLESRGSVIHGGRGQKPRRNDKIDIREKSRDEM